MARGRAPVTILVHDVDALDYARLIRAPRGRVEVRASTTPAEAAPHVADADVLFTWRFPPDLYTKATRLRWVQAMAAGVDTLLVPQLPPDVVVTRAPGVFGPWIAEYVVGWCGWISQRVQTYRQAQRERRWIETELPRHLRGTTMAVVGLGDIGRCIARTARGLGMRVLGVSRSGRRVPGVERVYRIPALARALAEADWAVVVLPLTTRTRGLIDGPALAALRPHAWLVNVGRGATVDEPALVEALRERRIAGAVLDVFAREPLPADHPLWALDNVVVTPHISGASRAEELTPIFNDNLARFLAGRRLRHVVDRARGY